MELEPGDLVAVYIAPEPSYKDISALALALEDTADWYQEEMAPDESGIYSGGYLDEYFFRTRERMQIIRDVQRPGKTMPRLRFKELIYIPFEPAMTVNSLDWLSRKMESLGYPNYAGDHLNDPSGFSFLPFGYLAFVRGLGGFTGTTGTSGQVRMSMMSDIFLDAITGEEIKAFSALPGNTADYIRTPMATREGQVGTLTHELSHLLGWIAPVLGRDPHLNLPGDSVHFEWWRWPDTSLSPQQESLSKPPWNVFFK